jgi:hypothetical protein
MTVDQISVFVENKPGKLNEVTKVLSDNKIDIRAMSLADTADFGILRVIVGDTIHAIEVLRSSGCVVSLTPVLAIEIKDEPGSLGVVLDTLANGGVNIEYMYAFITRKAQGAYVVMRVEDNDKAQSVLNAAGISVASKDELYNS